MNDEKANQDLKRGTAYELACSTFHYWYINKFNQIEEKRKVDRMIIFHIKNAMKSSLFIEKCKDPLFWNFDKQTRLVIDIPNDDWQNKKDFDKYNLLVKEFNLFLESL